MLRLGRVLSRGWDYCGEGNRILEENHAGSLEDNQIFHFRALGTLLNEMEETARALTKSCSRGRCASSEVLGLKTRALFARRSFYVLLPHYLSNLAVFCLCGAADGLPIIPFLWT